MEKEVFNHKVIEQIKVFMGEKHITCNKLADLSGISQSSLDRFLKKKYPGSIDYAFLARIVTCGFGMDMDEFAKGSVLKNYNVDDIKSARRKSEYQKKASEDDKE